MKSAQARLHRHLRALGLEGWELEHTSICEQCVVEASGYEEGIKINRCSVAIAHQDMTWELHQRTLPPIDPNRVTISMADWVDRVLREIYMPALKSQLDQDVHRLVWGNG